MNISFSSWTSDGKNDHRGCHDGAHAYFMESYANPDGLKCQCGETEWRFKKCKHCGMSKGYAKPIKRRKP